MTTWTNEAKKKGQVGITYNQAGKTYNNSLYSYWGKLLTVFTNLTKH